MTRRLLLVGVFDPMHVGAHLRDAAIARGWTVEAGDATEAYTAPRWRQRVHWWLRGRRPARLREFSAAVVDRARRRRPDLLLSTGLAPLDAAALTDLAALGIPRLNFLTDDPWSTWGHARWFVDTLPLYDHVYTPRHANMRDLANAGATASYLPFAYAPAVHFPHPAGTEETAAAGDIVFAGGADRDRIGVMAQLIDAGFRLSLYGGYWDRDARTRPFARGFADAAQLRRAVAAAPIALCLVRRANRDGHCMRSFEVPAMRGCVLAERTSDHETLYGPEAARFFGDHRELVANARTLLADAPLRAHLSRRAHERITAGAHTYADRFDVMLTRLPAMAHG
jgi:hypothetical protein